MIPVIPSQFRFVFFMSRLASHFVRSKSLPVPWTISVALGLGCRWAPSISENHSHATPEQGAVGPAYMYIVLYRVEDYTYTAQLDRDL